MRRDLVGRLIESGKTVRNIQRLLQEELHGSVSLPLGTRLFGWRHGFTSVSTKRYGLNRSNVHDYVSDYARHVRTPRINGPFAPLLNNKLAFSGFIAGLGATVPEYHCFIDGGTFFPIGERYEMRDAESLLGACVDGGRFIVKPMSGGAGFRVSLVSSLDGGPAINLEAVTSDEFLSFVSTLDNAVVCGVVVQHEYASTIFPDTTNSIRVITMWDYDAREPFIAYAGHRFGRPMTVPADNVSRGGLFARVFVEDGRLSRAYSKYGADKMLTHDTHPDTGAQIKDVLVPHWDRVVYGLLDLARRMPYIPYVGWDVIVTADGFTVTEGNNYPHLGHQCLHRLLDDPRVRAFYRRFGVV